MSNNPIGNAARSLGAFSVVAVILAIVATVLAYIFIVPEKKREKLNAFGKFLHDTFNFKYLIVEKILQALYIFFTADVELIGFFLLFAAPKDWYGDRHWMGGYGILIMILGPIMIRMIYELLMMAVLLLKNVISINNKLRNQNEGTSKDSIFTAPDMSGLRQEIQAKTAKAAPQAAPKPKFCSKCGGALNEEGKCPNCDKEAPQA